MFSGLDPKCKIGQTNNKLSHKKQNLYLYLELGDKLYHMIKYVNIGDQFWTFVLNINKS